MALGFDIVGIARGMIDKDPRFAGLSQERKNAIIDVAVQTGRVDFQAYLDEVDQFLGTLPQADPPSDPEPGDPEPGDPPGDGGDEIPDEFQEQDDVIEQPDQTADDLKTVEETVTDYESVGYLDDDEDVGNDVAEENVTSLEPTEATGETYTAEDLQEARDRAFEEGRQAAEGDVDTTLAFRQEDIDAAIETGRTEGRQAAEDEIDTSLAFRQEDIDAATAAGQAQGRAALQQEIEDAAFSEDEFIALMGEVGISDEEARTVWSDFGSRFTDPSYTLEQALLEMYDTEAFQNRFKGIHAMREAGGDMRGIPSPRDYLQMEEDVKSLLARYGLDYSDIDFDSLISDLTVNRVSSAEVEQRLDTAKQLIYNVPDEVKTTFMDWYGPDRAEANLMKAFIDPDDEWGGSWMETQSNIAAAQVGGWSQIMLSLDDGISQQSAEAISRMGYTQGQVWDKFHQLKEEEGLFRERLGEEDLTLEEGLEAKFGVDVSDRSRAEIENMLQRRREQRISEFRGGGGAMVTQAGTGLGAAR